MKTFYLLLLVLLLLSVAPPYGNPVTMGQYLVFGKPTVVGTCSSTTVGAIVQNLGGSSAGRTKLCICGSDGAATPAYAWCSISLTHGAAVVCTGGTTTVCP